MRNLDPEWSEGEIESGQVVKIQISGRTFGGCLSIKGRTKWKDKVSTSISILVSKRVFNRRHARTCAASDMSRVSVCASDPACGCDACGENFFAALHFLFIENAP